ncbi:hypothetical protein AeMF1_001849 [Aphanomyces euteiches]|nr:hypothetical protein AeMF1_001849 [Aphanomyces euteiches]KAH9189861.1 hypothetical protein AeNC1_008170 [Aphanomyces euteiches]
MISNQRERVKGGTWCFVVVSSYCMMDRMGFSISSSFSSSQCRYPFAYKQPTHFRSRIQGVLWIKSFENVSLGSKSIRIFKTKLLANFCAKASSYCQTCSSMQTPILLRFAAATFAILQVVAGVFVNDARYCEILFVRPINATGATADVYNTFGLNNCSAELWDTITPANAKDNTSVAVILNGPRYWLMDEFGPRTSSVIADKVVKNVQGINMSLIAQVNVPLPLSTQPLYQPAAVTRNADFQWQAGSTAFYLTNDVTGDKFIMQSYSQQVDKTLKEADLPQLGSKLTKLPSWWSYQAVVLPTAVNVTTPSLTGGIATIGLVLQDEFANSYSYAGDVDGYLQRAKQCAQVSVLGDATYCIPYGVPICSGSGILPAGTACPAEGDKAVADCHSYLPSFASNNCVAPTNAACQKIDSGAWGCVWTK